ncbi:MAG: AarF/ABC1/UbiB kinase family protein [Mariniblastus sp.]|nr:AarF/ABC1/UbiB kinase family protein [Mariniblastus sp.]
MMKIESLPNLVRDSKRFHHIVSTLARYGLAPWLSHVKASWVQKYFQAADGQQISELTKGERLRLAMTELGTTFIKLGQILSTRPDLVGPEITTELAKLQSNTPADSPEMVRHMIQMELGASPDELFMEFDDVAAASASIGQVHFAKLKDGTPVVVKVQHSGIEGKIRSDLEIMKGLAEIASHYSENARQFRPVDTMEEFSRTLLAELDFTREKRNLEKFIHNFSKEEDVFIPKPYEHFSTGRVLTMERLDGISLESAEKLMEFGYDVEKIAIRGANIFLEMIFRDGFYHADPHPGNIFAMKESGIGLLDCGMVGRIDDRLQEQFEDLLLSAVEQDPVTLCDSICDMGSVPREMDTDSLRADLTEFLAEFGTQNLSEFDLGGALNRMMEIIRKFQIILPARVSLLIKVLVMLEGTARALSPSFSLAEILRPFQAKIVKRRLAPQRIFKKIRHNLADWNRLLEMAPREMSDILSQVKRGKFDVNLEHRKLDPVINRMVMGILISALFVGSTFLLSYRVKPVLWDVSIFGAMGSMLAIFMGGNLVRAIRKSGNISSS